MIKAIQISKNEMLPFKILTSCVDEKSYRGFDNAIRYFAEDKHFVATDGKRLHILNSYMLPEYITKELPEKDCWVVYSKFGRQGLLTFYNDDFLKYSFPNYKKVIPTENLVTNGVTYSFLKENKNRTIGTNIEIARFLVEFNTTINIQYLKDLEGFEYHACVDKSSKNNPVMFYNSILKIVIMPFDIELKHIKGSNSSPTKDYWWKE